MFHGATRAGADATANAKRSYLQPHVVDTAVHNVRILGKLLDFLGNRGRTVDPRLAGDHRDNWIPEHVLAFSDCLTEASRFLDLLFQTLLWEDCLDPAVPGRGMDEATDVDSNIRDFRQPVFHFGITPSFLAHGKHHESVPFQISQKMI